jgi:glycosyltransferase involved in cell wall biosynthesis
VAELDVAKDVLFVGLGASPVCYYRCMLPAMALGADWIGLNGEPPKIGWATGLAKDENGVPQSAMPDLFRYKVVVIQQPRGEGWVKLIRGLREQGVKVIFEVDDYLHGIKHLEDHDFAKSFDNSILSAYEETMKACDALIASTEWIRGNYSHFNSNAYLCKNGIDLGRYKLTRPKRDKVNVGWAGATGHLKAIMPWLQQVAGLMQQNDQVNFVSIGQTFADGFKVHFGNERAISVPWAAIEQYPAAMTMFDIALAPGGHGGWWRGKSDLRWLEAGALGIPIIANPKVYPEIEDGVTGMTAINPHEMAEKLWSLVGDKGLREKIGEQAREYITENRSMKQMSEQWADVFRAVVAEL